MTAKEMIEKVLRLIEEYNPESELLTDDPDIHAKIYDVMNQIMYELARIKKIPRFVQIPVQQGDFIGFSELAAKCGLNVYQIKSVREIKYESLADGTMLKFTEAGTAGIELYVYPKRISADTPDDHILELSDDALEIMPYGVAADLLKSDVSAEYGSVYGTRYETMLQRLDSRYQIPSYYIAGGVSI